MSDFTVKSVLRSKIHTTI